TQNFEPIFIANLKAQRADYRTTGQPDHGTEDRSKRRTSNAERRTSNGRTEKPIHARNRLRNCNRRESACLVLRDMSRIQFSELAKGCRICQKSARSFKK